MIHTVKGFGIFNKAEIDLFLELCFFDDPADVGNLIPGSSAFSKSSLNTWKFLVHILLKPSLENFEHYFASMCRSPTNPTSTMTRQESTATQAERQRRHVVKVQAHVTHRRAGPGSAAHPQGTSDQLLSESQFLHL